MTALNLWKFWLPIFLAKWVILHIVVCVHTIIVDFFKTALNHYRSRKSHSVVCIKSSHRYSDELAEYSCETSFFCKPKFPCVWSRFEIPTTDDFDQTSCQVSCVGGREWIGVTCLEWSVGTKANCRLFVRLLVTPLLQEFLFNKDTSYRMFWPTLWC